MAEIEIERKRRSSAWPWMLGVLLLLLVAGTAWYMAGAPGMEGTLPDTGTEQQRPPAERQPGDPGTLPATPGAAPETAPPSGAGPGGP